VLIEDELISFGLFVSEADVELESKQPASRSVPDKSAIIFFMTPSFWYGDIIIKIEVLLSIALLLNEFNLRTFLIFPKKQKKDMLIKFSMPIF